MHFSSPFSVSIKCYFYVGYCTYFDRKKLSACDSGFDKSMVSMAKNFRLSRHTLRNKGTRPKTNGALPQTNGFN
ncbi:hypothetical protein SKAU_G00339070 [Synaphobranchus kaupii]|uniref:Uncharacterized protein n=1 Tax=Synaphobranchus kaupii TaxID=118154 RepID=A0A9Q1EMR3_SYNKA|nr:hypothetical protein SKAU_G00339070 [Synaphobranchus kaupii]